MKPTAPVIAAITACLPLSTAHAAPPVAERWQEATELLAKREYAKAEVELRESLATLEQGGDREDPKLARIQLGLAQALAGQHEYDEALDACSDAARIFGEKLGADNPRTLGARWLGARIARKSGDPETAIAFLRPLHHTLSQRPDADREGPPPLDEPQKEALYGLSDRGEHGLVEVAALLGRSLEESGHADEALPFLEQAAEGLEQRHGAAHPELVRVRTALDRVVSKLEGKGQRYYVGSLGNTRSMTFEGNGQVDDPSLRRALGRDLEFVLASHPAERLDKLLPLVAERLLAGYRNEGFPEATVEARLAVGESDAGIAVSIHEGPRIRKGEVIVEPAEGVDAEALRQALVGGEPPRPSSDLSMRIRQAIDSREEDEPLLPPLDAPDPEGAPEQKEQDPWADLLDDPSLEPLFSPPREAAWEPGSFVSFSHAEDAPFADSVRECLARQGRPLARVRTALERRAGDIADLRVVIEDPGPEVVVGEVRVSGNHRDEDSEIRKLTGLEPGQPVHPSSLETATLALWNSGRFFPFKVDASPPAPGRRAIDFHVRLVEVPQAPPLSGVVEPNAQAAMKAISHFNRGFDGEDVRIRVRKENGDHFELAWSHTDGLWMSHRSKSRSVGFSAAVTPRGTTAILEDGDQRLPARFDGSRMNFTGFVHLLPSPTDWKMNFSFGAGFKAGSMHQPWGVDALVSPSMAFIKGEDFVLEGNTVVCRYKGDTELLRIDAETGRLIDSGQAVAVSTAKGLVREAELELLAEVREEDEPTTALAWYRLIESIAELGQEAGGLVPKLADMLESVRGIAELIDLVADAKLFSELRDLFGGDAGWFEDRFNIPMRVDGPRGGSMLHLLLGGGYVTITDELFPDLAWAHRFSRELLFILSGSTSHTREVMDSILEDPELGPIGAYLAGRMLENHQPGIARRFYERSGQLATARAFRNDWRPLVEPGSPAEPVVAGILDSLEALEPEREAAAIALLPRPVGEWLSAFLGRLRDGSGGRVLGKWLQPDMDTLWELYLEERLRRELDARLGPPVDPDQVAAMVNGEPVPRVFVDAVRTMGLSTFHPMPVPQPDPARAWTLDPALARAVRIVELRARMHPRLPDLEAIARNHIRDTIPDLADADEGAWLERIGMTPREFAHVMIHASTWTTVTKELAEEIGQPEDEALAQHLADHAELFHSSYDYDVIQLPVDSAWPKAVIQRERVARAIAEVLESGVGFDYLEELGKLGGDAGWRVFSSQGRGTEYLNPIYLRALDGLAEDGLSEPFDIGSQAGSYIAMLRLTKRAPRQDPPGPDELRGLATHHWRDLRMRGMLASGLLHEETKQDIRAIAPPAPDGEGTPHLDALRRQEPENLLVLCHDAWLGQRQPTPESERAASLLLAAVEKVHADHGCGFLHHTRQIRERNRVSEPEPTTPPR